MVSLNLRLYEKKVVIIVVRLFTPIDATLLIENRQKESQNTTVTNALLNLKSPLLKRSVSVTISTNAMKIKLIEYIHRTSKEKTEMDMQLGKNLYATNSSFISEGHPHFQKFATSMRPGYVPHTRKDIAGRVSDTMHNEEMDSCKVILYGKVVGRDLDG